MSRFHLLRYGTALLSVALAALLMRQLNHLLAMSQSPFLLFFGAVMVSSWYGGLGPGLLATGLSGLISTYFFLSPLHSLSLDPASSLRVILFLLEGALISLLAEALRSARQRAERGTLKLQRSEAQYRRLVDTANEGIWAVRADGRTDYVNQQMAQMLGYTLA